MHVLLLRAVLEMMGPSCPLQSPSGTFGTAPLPVLISVTLGHFQIQQKSPPSHLPCMGPGPLPLCTPSPAWSLACHSLASPLCPQPLFDKGFLCLCLWSVGGRVEPFAAPPCPCEKQPPPWGRGLADPSLSGGSFVWEGQTRFDFPECM